MEKKKGKLFIISAPSGAGKSTVIKRLCAEVPSLSLSISCTTRNMRPGEQEGVDYHFVSEEEFERKRQNAELLEWAKVHNAFYGTPKHELFQQLDAGKNLILDIDVQGGKQVKKQFPEAISIFISPPSIEALKVRLAMRGTDSPEQVDLRLQNALKEMKYQNHYDYTFVNDELEKTILAIKRLITSTIS